VSPLPRIPLTVRHVYDFGDERALVGDELVRPEAWDALRTESAGAFAMPGDRAAWEASATGHELLPARAAAIDAWLRAQGIDSVASYGVGGASLEYLLWRASPQRRMIVSDYGPATVQRIEQIFPEVEAQQFDLLADRPLEADIQLFHRIDTELPNDRWRRVFQQFAGERILLVATELIDARRAAFEIRARRRNPHVTNAGWIRNRAAMERLWAPTHAATRLRMHDLHAWDLRPTRAPAGA
jgi:hypothetical protein